MQYFFADGDEQKGPFPLESLAAQGLKRDSLVWREGMSEWQRADALAELASVTAGLSASSADAGASTASLSEASAAPEYQVGPGYPAGTYPPAGAPLYPSAATPTALGYQQQPGFYGTASPPAGLAIASMVLGIVSIPMMCADGIGAICAIIAIVLGHIARGKARRGQSGGAGMALAGLICGYIALGLLVLCIAAFAVFIMIGATHHR